MIITDQPGRVFAIIFLAPFLINCGYKYDNVLLILIGIIFFIYELFWIIFYEPKKILI